MDEVNDEKSLIELVNNGRFDEISENDLSDAIKSECLLERSIAYKIIWYRHIPSLIPLCERNDVSAAFICYGVYKSRKEYGEITSNDDLLLLARKAEKEYVYDIFICRDILKYPLTDMKVIMEKLNGLLEDDYIRARNMASEKNDDWVKILTFWSHRTFLPLVSHGQIPR